RYLPAEGTFGKASAFYLPLFGSGSTGLGKGKSKKAKGKIIRAFVAWWLIEKAKPIYFGLRDA
ncbi:MAG: hypothetical protein JXM79_17190, partial [Sedimentisphaerales bacterium]|nr:hypothetical protein [Sedimentisphaerales bacterium]